MMDGSGLAMLALLEVQSGILGLDVHPDALAAAAGILRPRLSAVERDELNDLLDCMTRGDWPPTWDAADMLGARSGAP